MKGRQYSQRRKRKRHTISDIDFCKQDISDNHARFLGQKRQRRQKRIAVPQRRDQILLGSIAVGGVGKSRANQRINCRIVLRLFFSNNH